MRTTDEEKRMLDGSDGEPVRVAMEILCALGEIYSADRLIPIASAHLAGLSFKSHGVAGMEWAEDMARKGGKVRVPTTMNVIGVDRSRDLGLPREWCEGQLRIEKAYEAMGAYGTSTCVPYYCGFVPRFGQHIAWAESSAVVYVNSVLGARDNREGGPSAFAAAVCGCTPEYGLHLDENRKGDCHFHVTVPVRGIAAVGALGAYIGRQVGTKVPVISGLAGLSTEELVYLGSALASSGSVALFHLVGVTPEAPDVATALGGRNVETMQVGKKELAWGAEKLTSGKDTAVDYVALGCPHLSLGQVREVAELLDGKRVKDGVRLWIHTNMVVHRLATEFGYVAAIEKAGGVVTQDLCTILGNPEALGHKTLATNSPKMAFYAPGSNGFNVWYGSTENCLKAALTGQWEKDA